MAKKVKPISKIKILKPDLKDMIRDELYGCGMKECNNVLIGNSIVKVVCIPMDEIKKIAKRIAHRSIVGH